MCSMKSAVRRVLGRKQPQPAPQAPAEPQPTPEEVRLRELRKYATKEGNGLEIGPMHRPAVPKKDGWNVEIIDHLSQADLIERGKVLGIPVENIEEVDYIWESGSYTELTGKPGHYDYIVASHVIEHVPDFIGFMQDMSNLLKEGGVLSLAVPDKRFTFDHFRTVSSTGKIIDDYCDPRKMGSEGSYIDFSLNYVSRLNVDGNMVSSWPRAGDRSLPDVYEFYHSHDEVLKRCKESLKDWSFKDVHQNVFTPSSFTLIIKDLLEYEFIDLDIIDMFFTVGEEFIVQLRKTSSPKLLTSQERMDMLRKASEENVIL